MGEVEAFVKGNFLAHRSGSFVWINGVPFAGGELDELIVFLERKRKEMGWEKKERKYGFRKKKEPK